MVSLTQEYLRTLLNYDARTGVFTWRVERARSGRAPVGSSAGRTDYRGYRVIKIDGVQYFAHRLAWLYAHGQMPTEDIDHINRARGDNRLSNLRPAERKQNAINRGKNRNNTTGFKGVTFRRGRYEARTVADGRRVHVGAFKSIEDAVTAQRLAEAIHHREFAYQEVV